MRRIWIVQHVRPGTVQPAGPGRGPMMRRALLVVGSAMAVWMALGATAAVADQRPAGCTSSRLDLVFSRDKSVVRIGDTVTFTVRVANSGAGACDVTGAVVRVRLAAADGTPTGQTVTLATDKSYPAGSAETEVGTVAYTVAVNDGVTDAV